MSQTSSQGDVSRSNGPLNLAELAVRGKRDDREDFRTAVTLRHFLNLAMRGRHRGSSGGEKAARKMALLFLNEGLRLDGSAVEGLIEFIRIAKRRPEAARDAVDGW